MKISITKFLAHTFPAAFVTAIIGITPASLWAEDIEIYYSEVLSDNSINKNIANVLIMLDTSGSMRFCKNELTGGSGFNAQWCPDHVNRRINVLQSVLDDLLDEVDPSVRIGLGRFNYRISGSSGTGQLGGRIIAPVVELNDVTKRQMRTELAKLNEAGTASSAPAASAQPVGDTPTARAYSEAARYMMGLAPKYGVTTNVVSGDTINPEYCVAEERTLVGCKEVFQEGTWVSTPSCDHVGSPVTCRRVDGGEKVVPFCDTNASDCRFSDYRQISGTCDTRLDTCDRRGIPFWYTYYTRDYLQRQYSFLRNNGSFVQHCEYETQCTKRQATVADGKYVSPIDPANMCGSNHIILFTDGAPSTNDNPGNETIVNCGSAGSYNCQQAIAKYLVSTDNALKTSVKTHNIGLYMGSNQASMELVSDAGEGITINADSAEELLDAFLRNLDLIADDTNTMVAPGVAVSQSQRFQHLNEMYFALFKPAQSSYWEGNLKRYGVTVKNGMAEIQDAGNSAALDANGGFRSSSRSWWSASVDGSDIMRGGARERLATRSRKLVYSTSDSPAANSTLPTFQLAGFTNVQLGLPANATAEQRQQLNVELMTLWGDPLHSQPVMVNYGGKVVGDKFVEDNVVFVSTNAGMLHAIDTASGDEKFAFMPHQLLSNAAKFTVNRLPLASGNKRQSYGLDGSWAVWRQRGAKLEDAPSRVMLYGGMRRGGSSYFALNATNLNAPALAWQVNGGAGSFADLGQSWSTPKVTRFPDGTGGSVPAVVFGGGYSPADHDDYKPRQGQDAKGNAIYVVNAETGALLWSAGSRSNNVTTHVASMTHAIPGSIAVVDRNSDGVADHFYFADLGGQLFRADLDRSEAKAHRVTRLASLGGSGENHRRFYEQPTVAYVRQGNTASYHIAVASGYRAHPLDTGTQDGVFVVKDRQPFGGSALNVASLNDLTDVTTGSQPDPAKRGWYYRLNKAEGEKALSSPSIFNFQVLFTTYSPNANPDVEQDACTVRQGQSYFHRADLLTGKFTRTELLQPGLPAGVTVLFAEDGDTAIVVGTEPVAAADEDGNFGDGISAKLLRSLRHGRWMQLTPDDAGAIRLPADR